MSNSIRGSNFESIWLGGELGAAFDKGSVGCWSECRRIVIYQGHDWSEVSRLGLRQLAKDLCGVTTLDVLTMLSPFDPEASNLVVTVARGEELLVDGGRYGRSES